MHLLLAVDMTTPAQIHHELWANHDAAIKCLAVLFGLASLMAYMDHLDLLSAPLRRAGIPIPVWPTFFVLAVIAMLWTLPEFHENAHHFHTTSGILTSVTLSEDADLELLYSGGAHCAAIESQRKYKEANAVGMDEAGQSEQAEQIRASTTPDPQCPPSSLYGD